jgi:hypothetical protein
MGLVPVARTTILIEQIRSIALRGSSVSEAASGKNCATEHQTL